MTRPTTPAKQLTPLTSLRGVAAVLVVLFHYSGGFLPQLHLDRGSAFVAKGYLWVDFFFILSGFVIMHVYGAEFRRSFCWDRFRRFLAARIARLYPLHVSLLLAFVGLELARRVLGDHGIITLHYPTFSAGDSRSPFALLVNLLMLQTTGLLDKLEWNGPAWSIGAEWFAYMAFPVIALAAHRLGWRLRLAAAVAAVGGLMLIARAGGTLDMTNDYGLVRCLLEFSVGVVAYLVYERRWQAALVGSDAFGLLAVAATALAMHLDAPDVALPPLFSLLILSLALNEGRLGRIVSQPALAFLGRISYAIYLSHLFLMYAVDILWRATAGHPLGEYLTPAQSVLALAAMLGLVVAVATLLHQIVELPARTAVRGMLIRPAVSPTGGS